MALIAEHFNWLGGLIPGIDHNLPVVNVGFAAPATQELLLRVAYTIR
jgi:hypothetical protein